LKASNNLAKERGACPKFNETVLADGILPIDTYKKEIDNITGEDDSSSVGETIVLGGVFEETSNTNIDKVPFFGDIPVLGRLFRRDGRTNNKSELLIFVTPKILKDGLHTTR